MTESGGDSNLIWLSQKNKELLLVISCLAPAACFIAMFAVLGLYLPAAGCLLALALFLLAYRGPLRRHNFNAVFGEVMAYAYCLELLAAFYLEWEMGFQNLLFALIPLSFSFLYLNNNYEQILPHGIRYSVLVVVCYLICSAIDFAVSPHSGANRLEIRVISGATSVLTIGMIFSYVVLFVMELHDAHRRLMEETNARLDGMRSSMMLSQIKPHFLYNTIGAIEEMIDTDPGRAKRELDTFARYMRLNIDTLSPQELISFEKELAHIRSYVQIQNLRFGDVITVEYEIADVNFGLPPLTIQPIVENAIKHGLRPKGGRGRIRLSEREEADFHVIAVSDDGVGMDPATPQKGSGSSGLANIRYRLEKLCGGRVEIAGKPGCGTTVTVIIPRTTEQEAGDDAYHSGG